MGLVQTAILESLNRGSSGSSIRINGAAACTFLHNLPEVIRSLRVASAFYSLCDVACMSFPATKIVRLRASHDH